jgi:hypothetical protein
MHLRKLIQVDIEQQLEIRAKEGFPRMFVSLDYMHYEWSNYLVSEQGQFQNKDWNRSITLKAIVNKSFFFWHTFFSLLNGNNDINILDRSPLIHNLLVGVNNDFNFIVNETTYPHYYLLTDGIYL